MKRLVVGVLAHVDSGKTTLSEALLYRAGSIRKLGRVDHRPKTPFRRPHRLAAPGRCLPLSTTLEAPG